MSSRRHCSIKQGAGQTVFAGAGLSKHTLFCSCSAVGPVVPFLRQQETPLANVEMLNQMINAADR